VEHARIGEEPLAFDGHENRLRRRFDQRTILGLRCTQSSHGLQATAFGLEAGPQQHEEQERDGHEDQQRRRLHTAGDARHFGLDVIDVDTGAEDPAPGRKALDVGQLGDDARLVILPLPHVVDIARALRFDLPHHLDEESLAVRILKGGDVLPFEIRAIGMHEHPRLHVVDPEVVLALLAVVKTAHLCDRLCLSFLATQASPSLLGLEAREDVPRRLGEFADHQALLIHDRVAQRRHEVEERDSGEERDRGESRQHGADDEPLHQASSALLGGTTDLGPWPHQDLDPRVGPPIVTEKTLPTNAFVTALTAL
jgi:hypothetical protein